MHQWPPTKAYVKLKIQTQQVFEFSVSVCYGIPSLKYNIKNVEKGIISKLPRSDYYKLDGNAGEQLTKFTRDYRKQLARYTLLSVFSFFESFVSEIIREIVDFHGGRENYLSRLRQARAESSKLDSKEIRRSIVILGKEQNPKHRERTRKYLGILKSTEVVAPDNMFAYYGLKRILEEVDGHFTASRIPNILAEGIGFEMTEAEILKFQEIRTKRNSVAHGDIFELSLKNVSDYNDFLRKLAIRINRYVVRNYLYKCSVDA